MATYSTIAQWQSARRSLDEGRFASGPHGKMGSASSPSLGNNTEA